MPKGYSEEFWLFIVTTENLREDSVMFKYLKVLMGEGLKVLSFKKENNRTRERNYREAAFDLE